MMKIGILTFSAAVNYGAVLQAYALKSTLEYMGHDAHVIDYRPKYLTECYKVIGTRPALRRLVTISGIKDWCLFFNTVRRRWLRNKRFCKFKRSYLSLDTTPVDTLNSVYDVIICGSDQIWSRYITREFDPVFFGNLVKGKTRRVIAYAGSFGSSKRIEGYEEDFIQLLGGLDAISAREHTLNEFIKNKSNGTLECTTVLDPTLIAPRESFIKLSGKRYLAESYLLYFDLFNDHKLRLRARKIAKEKSLRFIEVSTYHEYVANGKLFSPVGPDKLLSLVRHADMVITTSFHCTVFSIIFERQFLTFEFEEKSNDRILNLLSMIDLTDRFVYRDAIEIVDSIINYNLVNALLEFKRKDSLKWLENNLSILI